MSSAIENGVAEVWDRVKAWPSADRIALASRILQSLEQDPPRRSETAAVQQRKTVADLWGAWATDQSPPTDEDVKRIIEEERMRKYG